MCNVINIIYIMLLSNIVTYIDKHQNILYAYLIFFLNGNIMDVFQLPILA